MFYKYGLAFVGKLQIIVAIAIFFRFRKPFLANSPI